MHEIKEQLKREIVLELNSIFNDKNFKQNLDIKIKSDNSIVTKVDTLISDHIKKKLQNDSRFNNFSFFSEEDHEKLEFPAIVLDPIDGTRELGQGIPECAVSLAIMNSPELADSKNWGWIFNPFTGFEACSDQFFCPPQNRSAEMLLGMVSRSEWKRGLHQEKGSHFILRPKGSIAYKLGLVSSGAIDFVLSKRPKNIWDIAAGSIICHRHGIKLWQNQSELNSLSEKLYSPNLVWASVKNYNLIKAEIL